MTCGEIQIGTDGCHASAPATDAKLACEGLGKGRSGSSSSAVPAWATWLLTPHCQRYRASLSSIACFRHGSRGRQRELARQNQAKEERRGGHVRRCASSRPRPRGRSSLGPRRDWERSRRDLGPPETDAAELSRRVEAEPNSVEKRAGPGFPPIGMFIAPHKRATVQPLPT